MITKASPAPKAKNCIINIKAAIAVSKSSNSKKITEFAAPPIRIATKEIENTINQYSIARKKDATSSSLSKWGSKILNAKTKHNELNNICIAPTTRNTRMMLKPTET